MPPNPAPRPLSPNSVLANALLRSVDMIRPKVNALRPRRIVFVVGTQINGAPHLGTSIVQTSAFLLAKLARRAFSLDTTVRFSALDNAPYEVVLDPETHRAYQTTYHHALGPDGVDEIIDRYYRGFFDSLSDATDTEYELDTYTAQQATPAYRAEFLRSLEAFEAIRWWLAPSTGVVHTRLPCPRCGWAEKRAEQTRLVHVDGALLALGTPPRDMPARVFTPMVLSASGGKLSKSLLRDHPDDPAHTGVEDWMLAATAWPGNVDNYVDALLWLVGGLLADPRHFYRSFTTTELGHLMATRPPDLATRPRAREMPIYKRYFDLIASGAKTIEIRAAYPSNQRLAAGSLLRFVCRDEECLTRIIRIATYRSFDDLFTHEDPAKVNPTASRAEQLVNVRLIYPADKEALGVMAIEVERL
jgi:ASC-1-like (ASCH) protein